MTKKLKHRTISYLGFAEKVLWVRVGDNPPLTPPRRGRQDKWEL
ncbi:hypothetical protein [Okeania sp. SIO1I7]|nr:hypothetical protein [Okeania sp. SIO1I7]